MDDPIDSGLDAAVRTFRTAAWAWLAAVTTLSFASVDRPLGAVAGVVAAAAVTARWWRPVPPGSRRWLLAVELAIGAGLLAADGWVFDDGRAQSFGGVWPLAGVLAVAVRHGSRLAVWAGIALGVARAAGEVLVVAGPWSATRVLAVASTGVLFALAGWAGGWAAQRIRSAERAASVAEARAEVAADLHDGVLQTLAVIQRRSSDDDLVHLARSQEADLRAYLEGPRTVDGGSVDTNVVLRDIAAEATRRFGLRVEVAAVPPLPSLTSGAADAISGAVGECLANVAKHGGVDRAVLYAEHVDATLTISVTDVGVGFDPDAVTPRGLDHSVERRIRALAGTVEIRSAVAAGTTVTLHVPTDTDRTDAP